MPDDLRTRIVAVQANHVEGQLTNYDAEREECGCGHQGNATYREHVADAVIRELEAKFVLVPKNVTLVQWVDEAFLAHQGDGAIKREQVTEWENDE